MASSYGKLPTEILESATTVDLMIFSNANMIKVRADKKARGEDITSTYQQSHIDEMYSKFKETHGTKG